MLLYWLDGLPFLGGSGWTSLTWDDGLLDIYYNPTATPPPAGQVFDALTVAA